MLSTLLLRFSGICSGIRSGVSGPMSSTTWCGRQPQEVAGYCPSISARAGPLTRGLESQCPVPTPRASRCSQFSRRFARNSVPRPHSTQSPRTSRSTPVDPSSSGTRSSTGSRVLDSLGSRRSRCGSLRGWFRISNRSRDASSLRSPRGPRVVMEPSPPMHAEKPSELPILRICTSRRNSARTSPTRCSCSPGSLRCPQSRSISSRPGSAR